MPKVSVIIPNYNHARFLNQRIQSVMNQAYQDFEVIYLDDASTDESAQVFAQYADDPRIRAVYNDSNSGSPFKQWNKGVREASGEYIWIAEADDYADERLLERLVAQMDRHPRVGLAYCQSWSVDEANDIHYCYSDWTFDFDKDRWRKDYINQGRAECENILALRNMIPNASAVLIRRDAYQKVGYADETMRACGDWMLWAKLLMISDIAFVSEPLNYFRSHSGSVTPKSYLDGTFAEESYRVSSYILKHIQVPRDIYNRVCQERLNAWVQVMTSRSSRIPWHRNMRDSQRPSRWTRNWLYEFVQKQSLH